MQNWISNLQFRSNSIVQYNQYYGDDYGLTKSGSRFSDRAWQAALTENLKKQETYTGNLCAGAKKRLTKAVEQMVMVASQREKKTIYNPVTRREQPFLISFITLTIYSTDRDIKGEEGYKQCLAPFLQWMRRQHGCKMYVWKAELQKRGQLHYHITSDSFIHWKAIREKWNQLQRAAGYLDSYYAKYKRWNANSTDVCSRKDLTRLPGYIIKEITKDFQNTASIGGKVWDCSLNLKKANYFTTVADYEYCDRLKLAVENKQVQVIATDHCILYKFINQMSDVLLSPTDRREYKERLQAIDLMDWTEIRNQRTKLPDKIPPKKVNFLPIPDLFSMS